MLKCACGVEISPARLAALPDTTTCVDCSAEKPVVGVMIWDHKTAPYIEVNTKLAQAEAGRKHAYGPHISFDQSEGPFGHALPMQEAASLHALGERLRREQRNEPDPDTAVEAVLANPSRCHPGRPRIGPSGKCLDCALAEQAQRMRRK